MKNRVFGLLALLFLVGPAEVEAQFGYRINPDNTLAITNYSGPGGAVTIPPSINGLPVTVITGSLIPSANANVFNIISVFSSCPDLTSVTIPETVTSIEQHAFFDCFNLATVTIPASVTNIGEGAFQQCFSLSNLIIANSVTSIGKNAFRNCTNLTSVSVPDSVINIGETAFSQCNVLTNATIGAGVTTIGNWAFRGCKNLLRVYFRGNAPELRAKVFDADPNAVIYYWPNTTGWGPSFGGCPTMLFQP